MKSPSTSVRRRDLLRALRPNDAEQRGASVPASALLRAKRAAMGSFFEIALPAHAPESLALAERALDRIDALESQMTIYREDSELALINALAHEAPVACEPGLFGLLERAFEIGRETSDAYDVTSGAFSLAWGFVRGPKRVPSTAVLSEARSRSGRQLVVLDPVKRTVAFRRPGVVLNLGSIGKGHAVDQAAQIIRDHWWPTSALIHGGRSSAFAVCSPPDRFGGSWPIALRNPLEPSKPLGTIWLRNRGLGTTGDAFQHFEVDGTAYGHVIDPRTGAPTRGGPLSVTVLAPTAAEADALSTAFSVMGAVAAADYCRRHPEVGALFVQADEGPRPFVVAMNVAQFDFEPDPEIEVQHVLRALKVASMRQTSSGSSPGT